MKSSILLFFISYFLFALQSCSKYKDDVSGPQTSTVNITGEWKWVKTSSGWGADIQPDTDSTVVLKLNTDSTYFLLLNDQVKINGHFTSLMLPEWDSMIVINFADNIEIHKLRMHNKQNLTYFKNDSCFLYDHNIADGDSHQFIRKH